MRWLSDDPEELLNSPSEQLRFDTVVVGSGYGGAVAALRLAEAGQTVCVLERGQEYVAGEFPSDFSEVGKHVRAQWPGSQKVQVAGYEEALFDFRIGESTAALVGSGLGGGSLINAGVGLEPDDAVFRDRAWPEAIQRGNLAPWFERARQALELYRPDQPDQPPPRFDLQGTAKFQALRRLHADLQHRLPRGDGAVATLEKVDLAVCLDLVEDPATPHELGARRGCNGCGNCVTGCNRDAKLSLTKTYLPRARAAGARLYCGITVLRVERNPEDEQHPWVIRVLRTADRNLYHETIHESHRTENRWTCDVHARRVVLAAGTFGTTEILLRSRATEDAPLDDTSKLRLSDRLGDRVSGNGDDLACVTNTPEPAHAVAQDGQDRIGPTISGMIRFRDPDDPLRSTLIQDGGIPRMLEPVFGQLVQTLATLTGLTRWGTPCSEGVDPLAVQSKVYTHSLTLLGMGHDHAQARIVLDPLSDRTHWLWPNTHLEGTPALHRARVEAGVTAPAMYLRNPGGGVLPDRVTALMSGAQPAPLLVTVHPLGGCGMGTDAQQGVCNHLGQVFCGRAGQDVYDGLYVMDGSLMPTSLGVNPLLTITALAERACADIVSALAAQAVAGHAAARDAERELPEPPAVAALHAGQPHATGGVLAEVLRGDVHWQAEDPSNAPSSTWTTPAPNAYASLFVQMEVPDWDAMLQDPRHCVPVRIDKPALRTDAHARYGVSRLVLKLPDKPTLTLTASKGEVSLFASLPENVFSRAERTLRVLATYLISRWLPLLCKREPPREDVPRLGQAPRPGFFQRAWCALQKVWNAATDGVKAAWRASEVRVYNYRLELDSPDGESFILHGHKRVDASASWQALWQWCQERRHGRWPAVARTNIWRQLGDMDVTLMTGKHVRMQGQLRMDLPDIVRNLVPQLSPARDSLHAIHGALGYPLMMLRGLIRTRMLDFRAPDYRERCSPPPLSESTAQATSWMRFPESWEHDGFPCLQRRCQGAVKPQPPVRLSVRGSLRDPTASKMDLALIRYAQDKVEITEDAPNSKRAKVILLINGFALSSLPFVEPLMGHDTLAGRLYDQGWDIWLLEYRISPLLEASRRFSTLDDIAAFDIPAAVEHICTTIGQLHDESPESLRIYAYGHCIASASLAMSMARGYLSLPRGNGLHHLRLAGVLLSQFLPYSVGSNSAQQRLELGAFIHNILGRDFLEFSAGVGQPDLLHGLIDRVAMTLPTDATQSPREIERLRRSQHNRAHLSHTKAAPDECCPNEKEDLRRHQPDTTTCKRMTAVLSRLYAHDKLDRCVHERLDRYFGRTSLGVFLQGAKCVQAERLLDYDGRDYLDDEAVRTHFNLPIMLLHGSTNYLFDIDSLERSATQLRRVFGEWKQPPPDSIELDEDKTEHVTRCRLNGFAHFDCTMGTAAAREVFPKIEAFLAERWERPLEPLDTTRYCLAQLPDTGPLMGWVLNDGKDHVVFRVWGEFAHRYSSHLEESLVRVRWNDGEAQEAFTAWPIRNAVLPLPSAQAAQAETSNGTPNNSDQLSISIADVRIPSNATNVRIDMFGVYSFVSNSTDEAGGGDRPTLHKWKTPPAPKGESKDGRSTSPLPGPGARVGAPDMFAPVYAKLTSGDDRWLHTPALGSLVDQLAHLDSADDLGSSTAVRGTGFRDDKLLANPCGTSRTPDPGIAAKLIDILQKDLGRHRREATLPRPRTLSRVARTMRMLDEAELEPSAHLLAQHKDRTCFVAACCRHPGISVFEAERADHALLKLARSTDLGAARFMALLGDQVYVDARAGLFDTATPVERVIPRYRQAFGSPGFKAVARKVPLVMVVDDHELVDNWTREHLKRPASQRQQAFIARTAYRAFQRAHGPAPLAAGPAVAGDDDWQHHFGFMSGSVNALVLDTRTARSLLERKILSDTGWQVLEQWLKGQAERDRWGPKWILTGSVVAPGLLEHRSAPTSPGARDADNWQMSSQERGRLFDLIVKCKAQNVIFLSGDYHCSAAAALRITAGTEAARQEFLAWAIVSPPLHAPMRFANERASSVLRQESIDTQGNATVKINTLGAWDGDGWLTVTQQRSRRGRWRVDLAFHLRRLDSGPNFTQEPAIQLDLIDAPPEQGAS